MGNIFDLFDTSETRCVAGLGLSALGVGLGLPVAAEACTEVVEKIVDDVGDRGREAHDFLRDKICDSEPVMGSGMFPLLFGPAFPVTTLTVPFQKMACGEDFRVPEIDPSLLLSSVLPFAGPGALLAYGVHRAIEERVDTRELFRNFAEDLVGGVLLMGGAKALKRVQLRQLKRINHSLPPELREQLRQAVKTPSNNVNAK